MFVYLLLLLSVQRNKRKILIKTKYLLTKKIISLHLKEQPKRLAKQRNLYKNSKNNAVDYWTAF